MRSILLSSPNRGADNGRTDVSTQKCNKRDTKDMECFLLYHKNKVKYKIHGHTPISLEEYMRLKEENK